MITQSPRHSAEIIAFPDSARRRAMRFEQEARSIIEGRFELVSDYEGGWYHTDAIREADRNLKQ